MKIQLTPVLSGLALMGALVLSTTTGASADDSSPSPTPAPVSTPAAVTVEGSSTDVGDCVAIAVGELDEDDATTLPAETVPAEPGDVSVEAGDDGAVSLTAVPAELDPADPADAAGEATCVVAAEPGVPARAARKK